MITSGEKRRGALGVGLVATVVVLWAIRVSVQLGAMVIADADGVESREAALFTSVSDAAGTLLSLIAGVVSVALLLRAAEPDRRGITGTVAVAFAVALQVPGYLLAGMITEEADRTVSDESSGGHLTLAISLTVAMVLGVAAWMVGQELSLRAVAVGCGTGFLPAFVGVGSTFIGDNSPLGVDASGLIWGPALFGLAALAAGAGASAEQRAA